METRHRYRVIIALEKKETVGQFANEIAKEFTIRFGGATILEGTGYWAEHGGS